MYCVFRRVPDAGVFALLLCDLVCRVDWRKINLPKLSIRISLHAAPVFPVWDAVSQTRNYTGTHTSRAARIEPITPPGNVYCTSQFASLSETLGVREYECGYVGHLPLAKAYGTQAVFNVKWSEVLSNDQFTRQLQTKRRAVLAFIPSASKSAEGGGGEGDGGGDGDEERRVKP